MDRIEALLENSVTGDIFLTGRSGVFSPIAKLMTRSRFSHVIIALGDGEFLEAYDHNLTLNEHDEGVYVRNTDYIMSTESTLTDLMALRPMSINATKFKRLALEVFEHSPPYPSVGIFILGFCCLIVPLTKRLPEKARSAFMGGQVRFGTDGNTRMHCSELAARLFVAADVELDFECAILQDHMKHLVDHREDLLPENPVPRRAEKSIWHPRWMGAVRQGFVEVGLTFRDRSEPVPTGDQFDLVMPGDFERVMPFEVLAHLVKQRRFDRERFTLSRQWVLRK